MGSSGATPFGVAVIQADANGAHPASDGAHRLGWWLADRPQIALSAARMALLCGETMSWLERIVLGEVEPGEFEREQIAIATKGAVLPEDWQHGGPKPWGEMPYRRTAPQPREMAA